MERRGVFFSGLGFLIASFTTACVGSDECTVESALLDSGDVILICMGDPETPEAMRARLAGETGYVVIAEAGELLGSGPPIVAPGDPSGFHLTKLTERMQYDVVDSLGSDLTGSIEVIAWSRDAYLSDERAAPVCLDPSPPHPHLFQCEAYGQTHPEFERRVVLFLVNDPAGLVLYRWGRISDSQVVTPGGTTALDSLRL